MKSILISLLYTLMSRYIGGGVIERIKRAALGVASKDIPGTEKKALVLAVLSDEVKRLGMLAVETAVQIVVLKLRNDGKA